MSVRPPSVAVIDEQQCIGCTLCLEACPVDAIVGASKLMHTVIVAACTGCELCIPPCPADCISMREIEMPDAATRRAAAAEARRRTEARNRRLQRGRDAKAAKLAAERAAYAEKKKRKTIAKALERARLRLQSRER